MGDTTDIDRQDVDRLVRRIWITKGCRFNCHARLLFQHRLNHFLLSMLSVAVIAISLVSLLEIAQVSSKSVNAITLIFSVAILVVGLLDAQRDRAVLAGRMHRSALELLELYNRSIMVRNDDEKISKIFEEYADIQKRYIDNHEEVDYLSFKVKNYREFEAPWYEKAFWVLSLLVRKFIGILFPGIISVVALAVGVAWILKPAQ